MAEAPISVGAKSLIAAHVIISGWTTEIGVMPKTPDKVIMISDTGGPTPNPKWLLDFPTIQVMVRAGTNGYLIGWAEAKAVKDILLGCDSRNVNDDRWVAVNIASDLAFIGRDENERPLFSINFQLIVEPQTNSDTNRAAL